MVRRGRVSGAPDRGAAAVEAALVLPLLLILVFGIIDFGRMLNAQIQLTEAAREGARARSLGASVSEAQARVQAVRNDAVLSDAGTECGVNALPDQDAIVTVSLDFEFITPLGALAGLVAPDLSSRGVMRCRG
jgi:Flp pilus assembly protein TadG